jgi:RNA polymerase sigma factor (sigma-70 family)
MNTLDQHDDAHLVSLCLGGDGAAWAALVRRYQRLVHVVAMRAGFDEHGAADVFQTVFARLVQHLPGIEDPGRLQAWIVTTAKREALLQRHRAARTISITRAGEVGDAGEGEDWDMADEALLPEELLTSLQEQHQVRLALARLEPRCRGLLERLFSEADERVPYEQIAQDLGMPVGSIGPTRARCLDKLRRLLEQPGDGSAGA